MREGQLLGRAYFPILFVREEGVPFPRFLHPAIILERALVCYVPTRYLGGWGEGDMKLSDSSPGIARLRETSNFCPFVSIRTTDI